MDISAVIISYNSEQFLEENLDSLVRQSTPFKQIVVVDNCSSDGSLKEIQRFKDNVTLIPLDYNSGYSHAVNRGIRATDSDLVLVANSDTVLHHQFNRRVLGKFHQDGDIALMSPLILRFDRKTVDSAGQACSRSLYPSETGFDRDVDYVDTTEKEVFSVCGAATVFRRPALEKLAMDGEYYDEDFFIFWEDFDIGWRARLLGQKTLFYPDAKVYHFRSGTLKKTFLSRFSLALARPATIKYHLVKNRYLTLIKNFRWRNNWHNIPFVIIKDMVWVLLLTFSSPKIIIPLMKVGKYVKRAVRKRKEIAKRMKNDG
ncbi:MAG: glycosyltransferase family 2 protein [bacterium]|nr:glycosyltransferase family 2 protein [bacterium]